MGIWLFLASEIMLFGALFSTYVFMRIAAPNWEEMTSVAQLNVPLSMINTFVLIT